MMRSLLRRREKIGMTLLGVGIFYFLSLAGTFAVVWLNAAHKTEAMLDYAASDLRDKADEVVDAVLANVGVALVDGVLADVYAFTDGAEQADDITLLGFKLVRLLGG